jgi:hypothetical protein
MKVRPADAGERLVTAVAGRHPVLAALLELGAKIAGRPSPGPAPWPAWTRKIPIHPRGE